MSVTYLFVLSILLFSMSMALPVRADSIKLKIIDQQQQSVSNAVVEVLDSSEIYGEPDSVTVMDQINKAFVPEQIVIQQGQAVDFPNSDNIRHHVYSFSKAKTFELKLYANKPEKPIIFEQPGIVVVGCNIHDSMIGYIYVAQHETVVSSSEQGTTVINTTLENPQISIWHPNTIGGAENRQTFDIKQLNQNDLGEYIVELKLTPPPSRGSFEDTFGAAGNY